MTAIQGSSSHRRHSDQSCRQVIALIGLYGLGSPCFSPIWVNLTPQLTLYGKCIFIRAGSVFVSHDWISSSALNVLNFI